MNTTPKTPHTMICNPQSRLYPIVQRRIVRIAECCPGFVLSHVDIFLLNHQYECSRINQITDEMLYRTHRLIVNIRGEVKATKWSQRTPVSDYLILDTELEEETISLPCLHWYAEAWFEGLEVRCELQFHVYDAEGNSKYFAPRQNFYFADAFNFFYSGMKEVSLRFNTWKQFSGNRDYRNLMQRMQTGFVSRENAATRKFYAETDKYYKTKLGIK